MRRALVTGCAGFVGSHLAERLVEEGREVVGVDCFTGRYARALKEANVARLRDEPSFSLREVDLAQDALAGLLDGIDEVFHLAGQASVRASFGPARSQYVRNNVRATRRLLEEAARTSVERLVYASSSSVYGDAARYPTPESTPRRPLSPYGMTKAAAEDLAGEFQERHGVPAVGLRLFTVYGPRQRPDMAFHRFIAAGLANEPIGLNDGGRQLRDFTYVADAVGACVAAAGRGRPGCIYNVGGGRPVTLRAAVDAIGALLGRPLRVQHRPAARGDARLTAADTQLARRELGAVPDTRLADGLAAQLAWMRAAGVHRPAMARAAGRRVP